MTEEPKVPKRFEVKLASIDPILPKCCTACLSEDISKERRHLFRRADGTVERVSVVYWPYCQKCHQDLAKLDRAQSALTLIGFIQMCLVIYAIGASMDYYDFWMPVSGLFALFFWVFFHFGKKARNLWRFEWARIEDVYKGGFGANYSFRSREFAQKFADTNRKNDDGTAENTTPKAPSAD